MRDIVERLRDRDLRLSTSSGGIFALADEAADEIERLRSQLNRHEWAESADRALMEEEIEHLRNERKALDETLRQEMHRGSIRNE